MLGLVNGVCSCNSSLCFGCSHHGHPYTPAWRLEVRMSCSEPANAAALGSRSNNGMSSGRRRSTSYGFSVKRKRCFPRQRLANSSEEDTAHGTATTEFGTEVDILVCCSRKVYAYCCLLLAGARRAGMHRPRMYVRRPAAYFGDCADHPDLCEGCMPSHGSTHTMQMFRKALAEV